MKLLAFIVTAIAALVPTTAFAYVDPGSGMIIWQGLLAAAGIALTVVRRPWRVLKELFLRLTRRK